MAAAKASGIGPALGAAKAAPATKRVERTVLDNIIDFFLR